MTVKFQRIHSPDCALHNMPAELPLPCDCGETTDARERAAEFLDAIAPLNAAEKIDAMAKLLSQKEAEI